MSQVDRACCNCLSKYTRDCRECVGKNKWQSNKIDSQVEVKKDMDITAKLEKDENNLYYVDLCFDDDEMSGDYFGVGDDGYAFLKKEQAEEICRRINSGNKEVL